MSWIKVNEYAKQHNIHINTVYKQIRNRKLLCKTIDNVKYVYSDDDNNQSAINQSDISLQKKIKNTYQLTRIKKLNTQIAYQKQKLQQVKHQLLAEYTEQIIVAYSAAYATFKNKLIALRLSNEQLEQLKDLFSRCTNNFITKLEKLRQEKSNENDVI